MWNRLSLIRAGGAGGDKQGYLPLTKETAGIVDDPEKKLPLPLGGGGKDRCQHKPVRPAQKELKYSLTHLEGHVP